MAKTTAPVRRNFDLNVPYVPSNSPSAESAESSTPGARSTQKLPREEDAAPEDDTGGSKKQKVEAENKNEEQEGVGNIEGQAENEVVSVKLGYKIFWSSVEMFDYFSNFLNNWRPNLNVNKYEHTMLLELLKKGHPDYDRFVGGGIRAFQIRRHRFWQSNLFYIIRVDGSDESFNYRECVDHIFPLPQEMRPIEDVSTDLSGPNSTDPRQGR